LDNKQTIENISAGDHDIIAMARDGNEALMQVFFIREGKMTGREHFMMSGVDGTADGEIMRAFITQFYSGTPALPKELSIQCDIPDREIVEQWLRNAAGRKVSLSVPSRGDRLRLMELAKKNAEIQLKQFGERIKRENERTLGASAEIGEMLGFSKTPVRIEAFDISNVQGYESVASMVVFEDGKPKRNDYRKFKLKTVTGPDDYASMEEVIRRRFSRYLKESAEGLAADEGKFSRLPDVLFIDGGKGQVSSAEKAMASLGIGAAIPVCGMVKDDRHRTKGLIYNNQEILPPARSEGFKLITRIQDETHRFAVEYHRKLREQAMLHSVLDDIPGIGPARRKALLRFFGSVDGIETADIETLMKAEKMNTAAATAVYNFFHKAETARNGGAAD
jgi:excinuclease ABC subunit C